MKMIKNLKDNKIFKIISILIKTIFTILLIAFILVVFLQRFSGNKISFFDYRMFTVVSGSMEPKYKIGDVLFAKEIDPSKIKIGDPISYLGERGSFKDKVITHEVIGIYKDLEGKYVFRAKGLANLIEDPMVHERQLYGKVVYKSKLLSFVYGSVTKGYGFYLFVLLPLFYIIGSEMVVTMVEKEEKRRKKKAVNEEN